MTDNEQRLSGAGISRATIQVHGDGDVVVRWSPREDIVVRGDHVDVEIDGDTVDIGRSGQVGRGGLLGLLGNGSVDVELPETVRDTRLHLRMGDLTLENPQGEVDGRLDHGDIAVHGGQGRMTLKLGAGDIAVGDGYDGPVTVQSGAGDVSLSGIRGAVEVQSGMGDVSIDGGAGDVSIKSGAGDTTIHHRDAGRLALKNGTGDVSIDGGSVHDTSIQTGMGDVDCSAALGLGHHDFTTGSGDLSIAIPRDLTARIEVTTARGSVESDVPLVSVGKRGPKSLLGRRLVGSIGEGSERAEINIRAVRGDVSIRWSRAALPAGRESRTSWTAPARPAPPTPPVPPTPPTPPETPGATGRGDEAAATPAPAPEPAATPAASAPSPTETEERAILTALAAGSISVEEANRLLDALANRRTL